KWSRLVHGTATADSSETCGTAKWSCSKLGASKSDFGSYSTTLSEEPLLDAANARERPYCCCPITKREFCMAAATAQYRSSTKSLRTQAFGFATRPVPLASTTSIAPHTKPAS